MASLSDEKKRKTLTDIAAALCREGHGLLACDESVSTIGKRLESFKIENNAENRRGYREVLLTAPNIRMHFSGAILFEETLMQRTEEGVPFTEVLKSQGIIPGVKVDLGLTALENSPRETVTKGLDTLASRVRQYADRGARFTKWRAAITLDPKENLPSKHAVDTNAEQLALYAKISQDAGLVAIVEPEILCNGSYTLEESASCARWMLKVVMDELRKKEVVLGGILLKVMMVMPGKDCEQSVSAEQIAQTTLEVMSETVPRDVPGVMFLSGGLSERDSTLFLNAVCALANRREDGVPWFLSFSYGRALQSSVMKLWVEDRDNTKEAKEMAFKLAAANGMAQRGEFEGRHPSLHEDKALDEDFRGWRTGSDRETVTNNAAKPVTRPS